MADLPPIRFRELADALLAQAETLLPNWLPGGRVVPGTSEYACASLSGGEGKSCSINLRTGKWSDFATGEAGGDLVSLYAAMEGLSDQMAKAAVQLACEYGLEDIAGVMKRADGAAVPVRVPRPQPVAKPKAVVSDEGWVTQVPVPANAPPPTFKHHHRMAGDIEHTAEYRVGADLYGYVVRFRTSDGGKDTIPYTWCMSARDGAAKWHWRQFDEPRPLYFPGHAWVDGRTVVLVEGEKKADALQALLDAHAPGVYCVASWPGGCKAWRKATWAWLAGCSVILWPDCDAKREKLSAAERKATPDLAAQEVLKNSKPMLPAKKQPGMQAMLGIGALLRVEHGCSVQLLPIPEPGAVADGWDCGDAILSDGWDANRVIAFFAGAYALPSDAGEAEDSKGSGQDDNGKKIDPPGGPEGRDFVGGGEGDEYAEYLAFIARQIGCKVWELQPNRKMAVAALRRAPGLKDCLAYDELRGGPVTRVPWPWRAEAGPLVDQDDLRLGDYLEQVYKLKSPSRAALAEAIEIVADERRFHPIRHWLGGLEWDGRPRLEKWLIHIMGHDPQTLAPKLKRYFQLVGKYIMLGQVYRVMEPGCKFDYSVVLEGVTGMGKSTMVRTLVGEEFFSDTHFDIGSGKDGMEQLAGIWAYELSEMTAFRRADSEAVKQFFTTQQDRYRGAYGRYVANHPRQCVIWCTTNKRQYLFDITGNRRFWPIWIGKPLNLEWLKKWRHQLFAEAYALWKVGERNYPERDEERLYFVPEQEKRLVETSVQSRLYDLLTREGAPVGDGKASAELSQHTSFVTVAQMVTALGTDPGKSSVTLETQIRDWLMENGWRPGRESTGQRRRGYARPEVWPPELPAIDAVDELDDALSEGESTEGGDCEPF